MADSITTYSTGISFRGEGGDRLVLTNEGDQLRVEIIDDNGRATAMVLDCWEAATLLQQYDSRIDSSGWSYRLRVELPEPPSEAEEAFVAENEAVEATPFD